MSAEARPAVKYWDLSVPDGALAALARDHGGVITTRGWEFSDEGLQALAIQLQSEAAETELRDSFAAKAMHALMTEPSWGQGCSSMVSEWARDSRTKPGTPERYAFAAYAMADAMLKARQA